MVEITGKSFVQFFKDFAIDYNSKGTIDRESLNDLLESEFPGIQIYLMNPVYNLFSDEQYDKFFKRDQTDQRIWTEKDNCWCFATQVWLNARRKMGNVALGAYHTLGHAVNIYVTNELKVRVREPQTDNFYNPQSKQHISM